MDKIDAPLYYKYVPRTLVPHLHYYNTPVQSGTNDAHAVLRIIKQMATVEDFVSFKLDIDTPVVEMPIFLQLLRDDSFSNLVDEFFFEIHFECEFLMWCGWAHHIPEYCEGFKMDRYHAMKAFQDLRRKGVRAHFWP